MTTFSGVQVDIGIEGLDDAIMKILEEYGDVVYQATEEGLSAAEKILVNNLKNSSPKSSGDYSKKWKGKGKKYKLKRYVGNTKMVKGKKGEIPLSNILEYSTKSPHQGLIKRTHDSSIQEMARAIVNEIKKEA